MNVCFTGHRPDKLDGYNFMSYGSQKIINALRDKIEYVVDKYKDEHITFICGGALGIDQISFELCRRIRDDCDRFENITIEVAVPFEQQDCKWQAQSRVVYRQQLKEADEITYVDTIPEYNIQILEIGVYFNSKMDSRNRYMVDKSEIVIAVWDGSKGGTGNCVKYANKLNKNVMILNPKEI